MSALSELYTTDFHAWTLKAAELVRAGRLAELNLEDLAECARRCSIRNAFLQTAPMPQSRSWISTMTLPEYP